MANKWIELTEKAERLRKNRESIPLETLRTKYRKSFAKLNSEIQQLLQEFLHSLLFGGLRFDREEKAQFLSCFQKMERIMKEERSAGTFQEISRAMYQEYNPEKALGVAAAKIYPRVILEAYAPYWLAHCVRREDGIWNDLINMHWDEPTRLWVSDKGEACIMFPPEEREIRKEMMEYGNQKNSVSKK